MASGTSASVQVDMILDPAAIDAILHSPRGDVMRDMMKRGEELVVLAKQQVRLGHIHGGGGHGNLRDSIHMRIVDTPAVVVGSQHPIALIHHEGTKAHMIRPVRKKALRWPGASKSGWLFAKYVHHPGTKPNRYLSDNLPKVMKG